MIRFAHNILIITESGIHTQRAIYEMEETLLEHSK